MRHKAGNSAMSVSNLMIICDATEDNEILYAYLKVIPSLTIFEANVLKQELDEAKVKLAAEKER